MAAPRQRVCPPSAPAPAVRVLPSAPPGVDGMRCTVPAPSAWQFRPAPLHAVDCLSPLFESEALVLRCPGHEEYIGISVPSGAFTSRLSESDANLKAREYAEANSVCPWWNTEQTAWCFSESDLVFGCDDVDSSPTGPAFQFGGGAGGWAPFAQGSNSIPADIVPSWVSIEDANSIALDLAEDGLVCDGEVSLPGYSFSPDFDFGFDSAEPYPVGAITSLYAGSGWKPGTFPILSIVLDFIHGEDDLEFAPLTGGTGMWASAGVTFLP